MGFIVFVSLRQDMASQYGKGRNISVSRFTYSANHNTLDSWPMSFMKIDAFQKAEHRSNNNVQYVENVFVFLP